jgi:hypothetical protein
MVRGGWASAVLGGGTVVSRSCCGFDCALSRLESAP